MLSAWDKLTGVVNGPFRSSTHYSAGAHVSLLYVLVELFWQSLRNLWSVSWPSFRGWLCDLPSRFRAASATMPAHALSLSLSHIVGKAPGNVVSKIKDLYPFWKIWADLCPSKEERVVMRKDLALPRVIRKNTVWSREMLRTWMEVKDLKAWNRRHHYHNHHPHLHCFGFCFSSEQSKVAHVA